MDTIRWDAMAALIALIGLPLMLSGSATWLIKTIINRIQRYILAHGSTCERLEWQDIPDGPLHEQVLLYNGARCSGRQNRFKHNDNDCFTSSLGTVFQHAWTSAQRRDKHVFKPYPLDPTKHYIRTDRKTLEAFLLLSHTSAIEFEDMNGILTAHLPVTDSISHSGSGELHSRTKHEVEMIFRGYPPFYLERIKVTDQITVSSPISTTDDIARGGWNLGVGLDCFATPPLSTHNLNDGYFPPSTWKTHPWAIENNEWMLTCMPHAINRFGEVLRKVFSLFPDDSTARGALNIYQYLVPFGERVQINKQNRMPSFRFGFLDREGRQFGELAQYAGAYVDQELPGSLKPLSCRSKPSKDEWQLAMSAFNHRGPLEQHEIDLFSAKLVPILQAGILGLVCVESSSGLLDSSRRYRKIPNYPELLSRKYIYLKQCVPESEE